MRQSRFQRRRALEMGLRLACLACLLAALCLGAAPKIGVAQGAQPVDTPQGTAAWYPDPHPILSDLRVRQAMAYCTDKLALIQSVYPLLSPAQQQALLMNSMIPRDHWAYAGDATISLYPYNPVQGKSLLEQAGWTHATITDTFRTNAAGEELAVKITTTSAAFRQTWAAAWEQQMSDCGIRIVRYHVPSSWWFGDTTGLSRAVISSWAPLPGWASPTQAGEHCGPATRSPPLKTAGRARTTWVGVTPKPTAVSSRPPPRSPERAALPPTAPSSRRIRPTSQRCLYSSAARPTPPMLP